MKKLNSSTLVTLIIAALGLFGTLIGIYTFFFPQKPDLAYEITSDNNLLNADNGVSNLSVIYGGEDIRNSNSNIKILSIKVSNNGNAGILINHYDQSDLLGIKVDDGRVIEPPTLLHASNRYLSEHVTASLISPSDVRFPTLIIEPRDYFVLRVVIIYNRAKQPNISALGKVAGVENIKVIQQIPTQEKPFWLKTYSGDILVQLLRLLSYTIAGLILALSVVFLVDFISTSITKSKRKALIAEFSKSREHNKSDEILFRRYIEAGLPTLNTMRALLGEPDRLKKKYKEVMRDSKSASIDFDYPHFFGGSRRAVKLMCEDGLITESGGGEIKINEALSETLTALTRFLIKRDPDSQKARSKVIL